ncbi:MAG: UbiA family prenyltransferase [Candidatus Omnitrophica bacterium]|nr:UbiA family prenyltransferase [Candidatus Omnitrophota bacterium]
MFFKKLSAVLRIADWIIHLGWFVLGFVFSNRSILINMNFIKGITVACLCFLYGYAFNLLCDRPWSRWCWQEYFIVLGSLLLLLVLASLYYAGFVFIFLIAVLLNTAYSLPGVSWKRVPVLSILINAYLFGSVFLFGSFVAVRHIEFRAILMTCYIAALFMPAQILHEMAHAMEDNRHEYMSNNWRQYHHSLVGCCLLAMVFSVVLFMYLNLYVLFLQASVAFWIYMLYVFFRSPMRHAFSVEAAVNARKTYRMAGILLCCFYLVSFCG